MSSPLVSVVVTTFDRPDKLKTCLDSVKHQSYPNLEVFVVDGSNSIVNQRIVQGFGFNYIGLVFDRGVQAARNIGVKHCVGKYICFLDDDDIWYKDKTSRQVELMETDDNIGLVICHSKTVTEFDVFIETPKQCITFRDLLLSFNLSYTSTYMVRKKIFDVIGFFNEDLVSMHEYDLGLRIAKNNCLIKTVPSVLMEKNNSLTDDSRRFYGSFFMKIHEVFLLWRFYGLDMNQNLCVKDFLLNFFKTIGLMAIFFSGFVFKTRVWRWVYGLKVWYERLVSDSVGIVEEVDMVRYVCGSCGHRVRYGDRIMGFCPSCGRDSLTEVV